jgi:UDP-N-acetylmuramoyl-tripeptide--D-alanyl-D-alanine ligase
MLHLRHIIEALAGEVRFSSSQLITDVVIDSRCAVPGSLFVAFAGEKLDGHDFVTDAFSRGAVAALVERRVSGDYSNIEIGRPLLDQAWTEPALPVCLVVEDTLWAIQELAAFWRKRYTPRVVGITGSVGKTTTKELVYAVLETRYRTLKSEGNLNNEIGLPLTLLKLDNTHQRVVLEMGMYARGEIGTLAKIAQPEVGVVTNIGPVHLERLGTMQAIADAKAELVEALPAHGVAILNHDEPLVRAMADRTTARVFTYGLSSKADLWADGIEGLGLEGIRFTLHHRGDSIHVRAPLLGRHSVHTALRAAAVGLTEGLDWSEIIGGLRSDSPQLRLVVVAGPNESLLLDDTYNASPASTIAALNLLADLEDRRVAILGDMLELGSYEEAGHRLVGRRVVDVADLLITVGSLGQTMAEEALAAGMPLDKVKILPDVDTAIQVVPGLVRERDMVLIKGSRGVGLNQLVDTLAQLAEVSDQTPRFPPVRTASG